MVIARSEQTTFFILHPLAQLEEFSVAGGKRTWLIDFGIIQAAGIARLKAEAPDLFVFIDHGCGAVHIRSLESLTSDHFVGINKDWVPLEDISPAVQKAILKAEDYRFFEHNGFDYEAIEKAMKFNQTHKRKKGASTVSQQIAKNVSLWQGRSWLRKGLEVYFTGLIEFMWSKERIMEVYL